MTGLAIGDIHLGHPRNKTGNIIDNLNSFFKTNIKIVRGIDIIFILGDTFDRLLASNSNEYRMGCVWLVYLIKLCKIHGIALRILEGTPYHDRSQCRLLVDIIQSLSDDGYDVRYINTMEIEYFQKYDANVLYIPDEYKPTAIETADAVNALMVDKGIATVDITAMHGAFKYQLPYHDIKTAHDEDFYSDITKGLIIINHIHTHSIRGKIVAPGSFDRLAHNEEHAKGCVYFSYIDKQTKPIVKFLENKNAMQFVTYRLSSMGVDEIIAYLDMHIVKLKYGSHIRIIVDTDMLVNRPNFEKRYQAYNLIIETRKEEDVSEVSNFVTPVINEQVAITQNNIKDLLLAEIGGLSKYTDTVADAINTELAKVI